MVPARQPSASTAPSPIGRSTSTASPSTTPPVRPLAPAKFTGSLYLAEGSRVRAECNNYDASVTKATAEYVQRVLPHPSLSGQDAGHCSGSCSGLPSGRRPAASPPSRRTRARAGWALVQRRSRCRCQCPRSGRTDDAGYGCSLRVASHRPRTIQPRPLRAIPSKASVPKIVGFADDVRPRRSIPMISVKR